MLLESDYERLGNSVRQLAATGCGGFEGLIQRLLSHLTGVEFFLAHAGAQAGRDMSSARSGETIVAVECKRYGKNRELDEGELKGKLLSATDTIPGLDLWVLAASRQVSDQVYSGLRSAADRLAVQIRAAPPNLPSIDVSLTRARREVAILDSGLEHAR